MLNYDFALVCGRPVSNPAKLQLPDCLSSWSLCSRYTNLTVTKSSTEGAEHQQILPNIEPLANEQSVIPH